MKILVVPAMLILMVAGLNSLRSEKNNSIKTTYQESGQVEGVQSEEQVIPYSIDWFRRHEFVEGKIEVENLVVETEGYTSYRVAYLSEGLKQFALMNVPTSERPINGYPVVIVNHGHIPPDEYSTEGNYTNTSAYYARQGFLVLKPDYRGHDRSEGETGSFFSKIEYTLDVMNLLYAVPSLDEADEDNIFMYGHSMGGEISLRVIETSDRINAASLWAPAVAEFPESHFYFMRRHPERDPQKYQQQLDAVLEPEEYDTVSVLANVALINTPIILHHGTADESVPYSWGEDLNQALINAGKSVTFYTYAGDNHDIAGNFTRVLNRDVEFFREAMEK